MTTRPTGNTGWKRQEAKQRFGQLNTLASRGPRSSPVLDTKGYRVGMSTVSPVSVAASASRLS